MKLRELCEKIYLFSKNNKLKEQQRKLYIYGIVKNDMILEIRRRRWEKVH